MQDNILSIVKVGAFALLSLAVVGYVMQYARSVEKTYPTRTFSVDGTGDIDITPDVAKFSVSVVTEGGNNVNDVQKTNAEKMNKVNAFLKDQKVEDKDLKTTQYNVSPRYSNQPCRDGVCPQAVINGYSVTQTLQVKVRDTEKLGALLSGVVESGANSVSDVQFVVDDDESVKVEARKEAMKKAKAKAEQIAEAGGFKVGKVVSIYENADPMPYGGYAQGLGGADMMKSAVPPMMEPGVQTSKVQVTVTYEIRN